MPFDATVIGDLKTAKATRPEEGLETMHDGEEGLETMHDGIDEPVDGEGMDRSGNSEHTATSENTKEDGDPSQYDNQGTEHEGLVGTSSPRGPRPSETIGVPCSDKGQVFL